VVIKEVVVAKRLTKKELDVLSAQYEDIQNEIKSLNKTKSSIRETMFAYFDSVAGKDTPAEIETADGFKFTREERVNFLLNETKLKNTIGVAAWLAITVTKREIDEDKLKKAIIKGVVDEDVIRKATDITKTFTFNHRKIKATEEEK